MDASAEGFPQFLKVQGVKHTHFTGGIERCRKNNKVTFGEYILSVTK